MHERLAVYVPTEGAPDTLGLAVKHIDRGSGIVGEDPHQGERLLVYYEGNRFGAQNIVTFADRCYFAASRLIETYPTVAQAAVPPEALTQVGWYYHAYARVEVRDVHDLIGIAHWLDLDVTADQLRDELRPKGVRV